MWRNLDFFYLVCEAIGTAATPGLLCQPRVIMKMIVEKQMECRLAGETEVLGENLPQRHFCPSQNPTWPDPGLNPGRHGGKLTTNRLSYGASSVEVYSVSRWIVDDCPYVVARSHSTHIFSLFMRHVLVCVRSSSGIRSLSREYLCLLRGPLNRIEN
jgi:hypothetical protein